MTNHHVENTIQTVLEILVAAVGLLVAGSVVWWSFANTETMMGGLLVSTLLLIPTAALYSVVATPVAALLGVIGGVVALAINRQA